jgi:hypothetical protein
VLFKLAEKRTIHNHSRLNSLEIAAAGQQNNEEEFKLSIFANSSSQLVKKKLQQITF